MEKYYKEDLNELINDKIELFMNENNVKLKTEEMTFFYNNEKEKNIYISMSIDLSESDEKYHIFTFKNKNKYKGVVLYDGQDLIAKELSSFLKKEVMKELELDFNFDISDYYFEDIVELENFESQEIKDYIYNEKQKKLLIEKMELKESKEPNIFNSEIAKEKFIELAYKQREDPERQMSRTCIFMGGGVMSYPIEHIGDLTHRMSQNIYIKYGNIESAVNDIEEKIELGKKKISVKSFLKEHEKNLKSNYKKSEEYPDFDSFKKKTEEMLKEYSFFHSQLKVYNIVQYHAREAAVNIGIFKIKEAVEHLTELETIIKSGNFVKQASQFDENFDANLRLRLDSDKKRKRKFN